VQKIVLAFFEISAGCSPQEQIIEFLERFEEDDERRQI
jgi:hypothetical protein